MLVLSWRGSIISPLIQKSCWISSQSLVGNFVITGLLSKKPGQMDRHPRHEVPGSVSYTYIHTQECHRFGGYYLPQLLSYTFQKSCLPYRSILPVTGNSFPVACHIYFFYFTYPFPVLRISKSLPINVIGKVRSTVFRYV
jgi:hypothetical protein